MVGARRPPVWHGVVWCGVVRALLDLVNDERTRPGRRAAETAVKREERGREIEKNEKGEGWELS